MNPFGSSLAEGISPQTKEDRSRRFSFSDREDVLIRSDVIARDRFGEAADVGPIKAQTAGISECKSAAQTQIAQSLETLTPQNSDWLPLGIKRVIGIKK